MCGSSPGASVADSMEAITAMLTIRSLRSRGRGDAAVAVTVRSFEPASCGMVEGGKLSRIIRHARLAVAEPEKLVLADNSVAIGVHRCELALNDSDHLAARNRPLG
jgi:hypothetical protein